MFVRNVRKDQVDFAGPADDEHVAGFVTEPVPLLDQRIERADQPWQLRRKRREVLGRDAEVPVGVATLSSRCPRPAQFDDRHDRARLQQCGNPETEALLHPADGTTHSDSGEPDAASRARSAIHVPINRSYEDLREHEWRESSGDRSIRVRYRPLNSFIAASTPFERIVSTASAASSIVTAICSRVRFPNRVSTWSAPCSLVRGLPTPIRTRTNPSSCKCCLIERRPLCPASPPPTLTRNTAGSRSS